jgi:uncharacterized Zn-binding protein involved in type VI secretion
MPCKDPVPSGILGSNPSLGVMRLLIALIFFLLVLMLSSCSHLHPDGVTKQDRAEAANDPKICLKASVPDVCLQGVARVNCNLEACSMISDSRTREFCLGSMETCEEKEYGVIEKGGKLYLKSKPGETLSVKTSDLPAWARGQIATVGAQIAVACGADSVVQGDSKVLLDGRPVARIGDETGHGGEIVEGSDKIFVNGKQAAFIGAQTVDPMVATGPLPCVGGQITHN